MDYWFGSLIQVHRFKEFHFVDHFTSLKSQKWAQFSKRNLYRDPRFQPVVWNGFERWNMFLGGRG